ncbi:MAG: hypothetical protein ACJ8GN_11845 [Longimicrobiaceae bacterium]
MPHPPLSVRRGVAVAALALLAGACSRDVLDPASPRAPGAAPHLTTASTRRPTLISNAVKYRDLGAKPATGRSGSSTLAARALLGKDGVTELEVTTGTFDPVPEATRPLTRLQVKQLDSDGHPVRTLNYNDLAGGGTAAFRYEGLARGTTLQVQGNVAEAPRTDVVTVTGTVHRRPDLRIGTVTPLQVRLGFPMNVDVTVSELNGDVGARADCVLYVDGVEADRARGIWVDAGDAVSCSLTHVFESVGSKQIRMEVANVSPGDFDPSNNVAHATVQVAGAGGDFNYYAYAEHYVENSVQIGNNRIVYDAGQVIEQNDTTHSTHAIQIGNLYASLPHGLSLATTSVRVSQSTDGVILHAGGWPDATDGYPLLPDPDCMSNWHDGVVVYVCSTGTADDGYTSVQYVRGGSALTYYGIQYIRTWWAGAPEYVYSFTVEWSGGWSDPGFQTPIGRDYSFLVELTDGDRTYRLDATVQMGAPETSTWTYYPPDGTRCSTEYLPDPGFRWDICTYHRAELTIRRGSAVGFAE